MVWFRPDGKEMTDDDWNNSENRTFALRLAGDAIGEVDGRGNQIVDDTLLILLNAHHEAIPFILPAHRRKVRWEVILDTHNPAVSRNKPQPMRGGEAYALKARSLVLLRLPKHVEEENGNGEPGVVSRRGRRGANAVSETTP